LNNAPAHQMAEIQVQPVERATARASIITDTLHQGRGEDPVLQPMAVFLQRAVFSRSSVHQYNNKNSPRLENGSGVYMSNRSENQ
jgi:hypothetical protein